MCLVERSGFGLNALLGLIATHPKAALATHEALERTAHDQNHAPLEGQQRHLMQSRTHEAAATPPPDVRLRSEEHTSELQSLMRTSYAVIRLKNTIYTSTTLLNRTTMLLTTIFHT